MSDIAALPRRSAFALALLMFVSGAGVMAVEIVGGMTIAPYFGSNVFVWGGVITVFMAALGLGYLLGGALADRWPRPILLSALMAAAGLLIIPVPFIGSALCEWLLRWDPGPLLRPLRPLAAVLALYFLPSMLLGMISPIAVRVTSTALTSVGRVVGRLYALNALGSVAGALGATFILVVRLGNRDVLLGSGVALLLAGLASLVLQLPGLRALPERRPEAAAEHMPVAGLRPLVFACGAVLMSLEIIGGAEIAPYFGSSVFVWGSVISVFLGALTVGYRLGGRLADRRPRLMTLATLVVAAGIAVQVVPLVAPLLCAALIATPMSPGLSILRPLVVSLVLYFIPIVLFAMVAPFAVRLATPQVGAVGRIAGRFYALSTLGNVVGVLLTTFLLISTVGKTRLFGLAGFIAVLAAVVAVLLHNRSVGEKRQPVLVSALLLAAVAALALMPKPSLIPVADTGELVVGHVADPAGRPWCLVDLKQIPGYYVLRRVRAERESPYHHIAIIEQKPAAKTVVTLEGKEFQVDQTTDYGTRRELRFDQYVESAVILNDDANGVRRPYTSGTTYADMLHLPLVFNPDAKDVLVIGGGGGVVPMVFHQSYPNVTVDVVEIDPVVVDVARRWFGFAPDNRLRIHVEDGRMFIHNSRQKYDLILLDAYTAGGRIPFHLTTTEFLAKVRGRLRPRGVALMNVISAVDGRASQLFRAEYKTFKHVFGADHVYVFPKKTSDDFDVRSSHNIILIATGPEHPRRLTFSEIVELARKLTAENRIRIGKVARYAENMLTDNQLQAIPQDDVPLLTDDYAPVDMMIVSLDD